MPIYSTYIKPNALVGICFLYNVLLLNAAALH